MGRSRGTPRKRGGVGEARTPIQSPGVDASEAIGDNDDVAERALNRQRRKEALARAHAASPFKSPHARRGTRAVAPPKQKLTDEGIADLYSNCIKLSADNVRTTRAVCWS